ncbi:MAG: 2-phosphosulfolactate phosphatase [Solirubrobacteraceae bacterium]
MSREPLIDVAFTPGDVSPAQVAVAVDVLRASSTIVTALSRGYAQVLCCDGVERAEGLRGPGRVLAGERECRPVPGFDCGNSPGALDPGEGRELVLSTTNGTPAILAAAAASDEVLVGALLNLDGVVEAIPPEADVTVVCAGTDGRFALEDAYAAGRLVGRLRGERTDAAHGAERLALAYSDSFEPLAECADAAVLRETDQADDIVFCARESEVETVPRVTAVSDGVATVSALAGGATAVAGGDEGAAATVGAPGAQNRLKLIRTARSFG